MKKEADAVTRLYDFILYIVPKLDKSPRSQKFLLADRIETTLLDTLELLVEAACSPKKTSLLKTANVKLEILRCLMRLSRDLKLVSSKTYEFSVAAIDGVGISVDEWLKYPRNEAWEPPF